MPSDLSIADLIANGTLSAEQAATLWAVVEEQRSFIVVAIPRFAGKSTTMDAVLGLLTASVPVHRLSGDEAEMDRFKQQATGGYLVVSEFSEAPVANYIWGAPVRRVFDTLTAGYSLAAALHASSLEEAFDAICKGNGVSDEAASRIGFMLYIRRFGDDEDSFWRRLAEIHEIDSVSGGRPSGRLLHRWDEAADRFDAVESSRSLKADAADLARRASMLRELVTSGRTSTADVAQLVAGYGTGGS